MQENKIQYYEKVTSDLQMHFLQTQNHCALCGSVLILEHGLSEDKRVVTETAHCPECNIRNRSRGFTVH